MLTGQAKNDFLKEKCIKESIFDLYLPVYLKPLITKWFDGKKIFIFHERISKKWNEGSEFFCWYFVIKDENGVHLNDYLKNKITVDDREEIITKGIEEACKIYNDRYEKNREIQGVEPG